MKIKQYELKYGKYCNIDVSKLNLKFRLNDHQIQLIKTIKN